MYEWPRQPCSQSALAQKLPSKSCPAWRELSLSKSVKVSKPVITCQNLFIFVFVAGNQNSSHHNRGTPPPGNMKTASRPVNSNTGLGGSGGLNNVGRGGTSGLGNSGSGHHNMKNVLTPDLSLLKPVSVVSLKNSFVSFDKFFLFQN